MARLIKLKQFFTPILTLFLAAILCFLPGYAPILYYDDWYTFGQLYVFGGLRLVDWADRRPLLNAVPKILLDLFGLNLKALYFTHYFVIFLCAVVFFFLARRLFPSHKYLALPAALLFLVFPVDLTRIWLSMNYQWVNYLATLIALYFLFDFAEKGQFWKLALSFPFIVLPLWTYESQLGILVAWSMLLVVFTPRISYKRRLLLLFPLGIAALFLFWRIYIQPVVLNVHDPYMTVMDNDVRSAVGKGLKAILPVLVNSWILPFASLLGISARRMLLILAGAIACIGMLSFWASQEVVPSRGKEKADPSRSAGSENLEDLSFPLPGQFSWNDKKCESLPLLASFGVGLIMLFAGYIPYILIVTPALDWISSRANTFANFGSAIAITSGIALIALWVSQKRSQMRFIAISIMIPLLLMGATEQIWNQHEERLAWTEQKHFWQALFQAVPDLRDGTTLVVVMPYETTGQPYKRLPFSAFWDLTAGLRVLYNNPTLSAIPYTPNHVEGVGYGKLTPAGVENADHVLTPYDRSVIVYYQQGSYEVKLVNPANPDFPLKFPLKGYAPEKNILPDPPPSTPYRGLVQQ